MKEIKVLMERCPLCRSLNLAALGDAYQRCQLCCIAIRKGARAPVDFASYRDTTGRFDFPNWNNWLFRSTGHLSAVEAHQFSPPTVRIWALQQALRLGRLRTTMFGGDFGWAYGRRIRVWLEPEPAMAPQKVSLGILSRMENWDDTVELCRDMAGSVEEVVVALDAERADPQLARVLQEVCGISAKVLAHPVAGDFAAQRNRVQDASASPWVLQLDTDERLTTAAKRKLHWLVSEAERSGWDAIALPRQNIVDGVVSAHYPDVQYRLVRKAVRFLRKVHEYPDLRGRRSIVAPDADIRHLIASERLLQREQTYEAILPGGGRPHDTALLRAPLKPDWELPR